MLYTCENGLIISPESQNNIVQLDHITDYKLMRTALINKDELMSEIEIAITNWRSIKTISKNLPILSPIKDTEYFNAISLSKIYGALCDNKPYDTSEQTCLFKANIDSDGLYLEVSPLYSLTIQSIIFRFDSKLDWNYDPSLNNMISKNGDRSSDLKMYFGGDGMTINSGRATTRATAILRFKVTNEWFDMLRTYLKIFRKLNLKTT